MMTPAEAAEAAELGHPTALKRGRDPRWPYVPAIVTAEPDTGREHTRQLLRLAFATRAEALEAAEAHIAAERANLARRLAEPRNRALRRSHGLPAELAR